VSTAESPRPSPVAPSKTGSRRYLASFALALLSAVPLAACVPAYQVPDGAARATLKFEVRQNEGTPFVTHYFRQPEPGVCKTTGALGSISQGNPLVRTKDSAEVPADIPLHLEVAVVPHPAERCNRVVTFTPKAGSTYTVTTVFDRSKMPACSTTIVADKGLAQATEVPVTSVACPSGFLQRSEP
jgi:hypothetical protein